MSEVTALLSSIIAFRNVSAGSNLPLLAWIEDQARPHGVTVRRFPDPTGQKASLLLTIGPERPGGILLSGHTDVVPCEGQAWSTDPWTARIEAGRLIGRGSSDMQGFIACCLAALPAIAAKPLERPVHMAFSYDEEVGCTGVWDMAEWIGASAMRPRLAVIGEPTEMHVANAHKGGLIGWCHVKGVPGHSSQPDRYVNAVMVAAEMIAEINRIREDMRDGPHYAAATPPYSTIQVNQIRGGLHGNIVAEDCTFFWEMRITPGSPPDSDLAVLERMRAFARDRLEPGMKRISPAAGITFTVQARIPPLDPTADAELLREVLDLTGTQQPLTKSGGTEAGIFALQGIPALVIGPGANDQPHQPDEYVEIALLDRCIDFIDRLTDSCGSGGTKI